MSTIPPDELNPFQAPRSEIGAPPIAEVGGDPEAIRRTYLRHEAAVKSIGLLAYLGAAGGLIGAVGILVAAVAMSQQPEVDGRMNLAFGIGIGIACLLVTGLYWAVGRGIRQLQPWARWTVMVLFALGLVINAVQALMTLLVFPLGVPIILLGMAIPAYIVYLLASAKGAMVFSPAYREVVRQTPHIRSQTSLLVKILLGFLLALISLGIIVGILGGLSGR